MPDKGTKQKRLPWTKFHGMDWLGDVGLRACSLAAQGLWANMISLAMQDPDNYGYLTIGGEPMPLPVLAKIIGSTEEEITPLIDELGRFKVFSRNKAQTIYSRRMVREDKKRKQGRKHAEKQQNPKRTPPAQDDDNKGETDLPLGGGVGPPPSPRVQRPESRGQSLEENTVGKSGATAADGYLAIPGFLDRRKPDETVEATRLWNEFAAEHGLSRVLKLTDKRKSCLKARLKDCGGIEGWVRVLEKVAASPGLLGQAGGTWQAGFDFLMQESSFTKVMEGFYDRWTGEGGGKPPSVIEAGRRVASKGEGGGRGPRDIRI